MLITIFINVPKENVIDLIGVNSELLNFTPLSQNKITIELKGGTIYFQKMIKDPENNVVNI